MPLRLGGGRPLSVRLRLLPSPTRRTRPFCRFATFSPFHRESLPQRRKRVFTCCRQYIYLSINLYRLRRLYLPLNFFFFGQPRIKKDTRNIDCSQRLYAFGFASILQVSCYSFTVLYFPVLFSFVSGFCRRKTRRTLIRLRRG